jgi:N-hydroxyarylamine O-acetyltransferase
MDPGIYLARIGAALPAAADLATLAELQRRHLLTVPFENLSVLYGEPIVLEERQLYAKVVERRRGGFCYELNGLFAWLLRILGYRVDRIAAEVYDRSAGQFGLPFDHMALIVHLDRPYLVDVGFGDSARTPLPLPDGMAEDVSGAYRVAIRDDHAHLERRTADGWIPEFRFTTQPHTLADYHAMCGYHSTSPESHFTRRLVCTRATTTGRLTLTGDAFVVTRGRAKRRTPVAPAQRAGYLLRHFGIHLAPLSPA